MAKETAESGKNREIPRVPDGKQLEELQRRLAECRQAVSKEPRNVVLLNDLGLAAETVGDFDRAQWAFKRATKLDPSYGPAYQNLGLLLKRYQRTTPAIYALESCLKYAGRDCDRELVKQVLQELHEQEEANRIRIYSERQSVNTRWDKAVQQAKEPPTPSYEQPDRTIEKAVIQVEEEHFQDDDGTVKINPSIVRPLARLGLTPAEALMLLDPDGSDPRSMLRYTVLDLINRNVLEVDTSGKIGQGDQFDQTELEAHEYLLASFFDRFDLGIDLAHFARAILARLDKRYPVFKLSFVRQLLLDKGYLETETSRWLGILPVRRYVLSQNGLRVMHQLKRQLKLSRDQIQRLLRRDPQLAKAYLTGAGAGLILLEDFKQDEFTDWRQIMDGLGFEETSDEFGSMSEPVYRLLDFFESIQEGQ